MDCSCSSQSCHGSWSLHVWWFCDCSEYMFFLWEEEEEDDD